MKSLLSAYLFAFILAAPISHGVDQAPVSSGGVAVERNGASHAAVEEEDLLPVPGSWRTANGQGLRDSERTIISRYNLIAEARREVEDLGEERARWERELQYAQTKLVNARTQLGHYDSKLESGNGTVSEKEGDGEYERWQREVAAWEAQIGKAENELVSLDALLEVARERLQAMQLGIMPDDLLVVGDALDVAVLEDETLNGFFPIRRGGYIVMPRIGRVFVAGKEIADAEATIAAALEESQIRKASVVVERSRVTTLGSEPFVFLTGEFKEPGPWEISEETRPTLVTTILQSGGITELGDLSRVRLLRLVNGQQLVEEFDVQAMLEGQGLATDVPVQPGDIVVVPIAPNLVYVTGNVEEPGPLQLSPHEELKAYSAILRSGGFARFANRKKVYVLRDTGDEAKERIDINIIDIQEGAAPDVILQNNDIIVVPERFFSF